MIIDTWTYNKIDFIQLRHDSHEQSYRIDNKQG